MRRQFKKSAAWLGIVAVALHVMLLAVAPIAAAGSPAGIDPFSVICHSGGDAGTDQAPVGDGSLVPSHACEHCNLCSAINPPPLPDVILAGRLLPERVLALLSPASVPRRDGVASNPKRARGPPAFT